MTTPRQLSLEQARIEVSRYSVPELIARFCNTVVNGNPIPTLNVVIGRGILKDLAAQLSQWLPPNGRWAVVMDSHTRCVAGDAVLAQCPGALPLVLDPLPGWDHVTPHDRMVDRLADAMETADAMIAVGSGTINDLCKTVSHRQGKPYVIVATAPSMNGYTSSLAAIVVKGLKTTCPCPPPRAVIADVDVLVTAPADMARSGYADMMAKSVSSADWRLGSLLMGGAYHDLPARLVERALNDCVACAEGIDRNEPEAIEILMRCLVLSGFAMTLAGSSAPASGGEHLISHYWDMSAYLQERPPPALHGLQVGLGVLLTARLYELLWQQDPASFTPTLLDLNALSELHGDLWPAFAGEAEAQQMTLAQAAARVAQVQDRWPELVAEVQPIPRPSAGLRKDLMRAGVPVTPGAYGLSMDLVKHTLLHAAEIRNRYSVLHFARDLGMLDRLAPDVLQVFDED